MKMILKTASDAYYEQHRHQLLAAAKQYHMTHRVQIAKHQKAYNRKVDMGLIRPQKRIVMGHDYQFMRR